MSASETLKWHHSWIIRASLITACIFFVGFVASIVIATQGINKMAKIAAEISIQENLPTPNQASIKQLKSIDKIRMRLVESISVVLAITFFLLFSVIFLMTRQFKWAVERMIQGFSLWSDKDPQFRFGNKWRGELRLITAQFNAMADDIEVSNRRNIYLEKVASWQIIARKLAHEIKNPLTPIQMMMSQLQRKYKGDDLEFKNLLQNAQSIISEEIDALKRMVENFSEFASLPIASRSEKNLIPCLKQVVDLEKAAYPAVALQFSSVLSHAILPMDEDLIRQVLINLIKNAAEACSETKNARIDCFLEETKDHFVLRVCDNGPGIPESIQAGIFEAYFTTKHSGPHTGMGLGLAICQKIVLDHDGELLVRSQPGDTKFIIHLPKKIKIKKEAYEQTRASLAS